MRTLKKTLALVLVVAMMMSLCITASAFDDADEITYTEAVEVLTALGVVNGMGDGTFAPNGTLTRGQAAAIITRLMDAEAYAVAKSEFTDCVGHWADKYIAYCAANGIVSGYGDGTFGPDDELTGYQFAKMLLAVLGADTSAMTGSAWQIAVAKAASDYGIFAGNLAADKTAPATREEACLYALNALNYYTQVAYGYPVYLNGVVVAHYDSIVEAAAAVSVLNGAAEDGDVYTYGTTIAKYGTKSMLLDTFGVSRYENTLDSFGCPGTYYSGAILGYYGLFFSDEPIATFTATTSQAAAFAAIGAAGNSANIEVYDAVAETSTNVTIAKNGTRTALTGTGNGVYVEVYNLGTAAVPYYYAVSVAPAFGQVTISTKNATKLSGGYVNYVIDEANAGRVYTSVVNPATEYDTAVVSGDVANGDWVLYYTVGGVLYIEAVDTITGVLSSKTAAGVMTIDGEAYVAAACGTAGTVSRNEQSFYVDSYGYILGTVAAAPDATVYAMVLDTDTTWSLVDGKFVETSVATIVYADGSVATVETVDSLGARAEAYEYADLAGKVVEVEEGLKGTVLVDAEVASNVSVLNPKSNVLVAGELYANANTVFVYANFDMYGVPTGEVTVITGISKVSAGSLDTAYAMDLSARADKIADVVFIYDIPESAATDTYVYVTSGNYTESAQGYTYSVIIAGEETTLTVTEAVLEAGTLYASIVDDGETTTAVAAEATNASIQNNGGLLFIDGSYSELKITDTTPIYMIDNYDATCTVITFADLTKLEGDVIVVTAGTNVLAVYYVYTTQA